VAPPPPRPPPLPGEFSLIARHFRRLAGPGSLDLSDDAAVFDAPPGRQLVAAADAMVAGVHFLPDDPPETIGRKLLRVNLSDLAAMGASPLGYLLTVALPRGTPDAWIAAFVDGLAADNALFGVHALGGDTVSTPGPASLSLTVLGTVASGAALLRGGARPGDRVWVSGTVGDGALGLRVLRGELAGDAAGHLARRYRLPEPRLALGAALSGVATAAMDVSDGLLQDLGHLCRASGCGATVEAASVPLSDAARAAVEADGALLPLALTGGDDYELLFAAPPERSEEVLALAAAVGTPATPVGVFVEGPPEVAARGADGAPLAVAGRGGWSHF
jgi:thiamine-monophosphate kinase